MNAATNMSKEQMEQTRAWLKNWETLGPVLESLRHEELRRLQTVTSLTPFNTLFRMAIRESPPGPTSGLIEQQALFSKFRR